MEIREITEQPVWDSFVQSQPDYTFLNAWAWGTFNESLGNKIWRLGMFEGEELVGVALVVLVAARRGRFLFVPHGPLLVQSPKLKIFVDHLKNLAHQEHCSFIRVSPLLLNTPENEQIFQNLNFRPAPMHMHAETTWMLNLLESDFDMLAVMRKTTRYLIRRGEKDGVEVVSGTGRELFEEFYRLYEQTARRQDFVPFSRDYIAKELAAFGAEGARIYLARAAGEVTSGAVIVFYGARAFYHHGASLHHPTASYLLQWRIIQDVKRRGFKEYNFWGVDFRPKHPWAGVTLFKTGFGGRARAYLPAQDLPLTPSYWLNWSVESIRRVWRRY